MDTRKNIINKLFKLYATDNTLIITTNSEHPSVMNNLNNYVPVNVINAGIGGITAKDSVKRVDTQVLSHRPDLIIICFGLN